ncbi:MAG: UvrD-helicase domain-containing protein [Bacteroidota bacterium]
MPHYLEQLNTSQREAVVHTDGPCMVVAGAGAGKTKVLTCRIAHLLHAQGVDPFRILAVTFTNKAANEMRERIRQIVGDAAQYLWLGTFHSVFSKILRIEAAHLGYPAHFSIYDTADSKSLIKAIVKKWDLDEHSYGPNTVLSRISGAKNRLITAQEYAQNPTYKADDERVNKPRFGELFLEYTRRCFQAGAMDFDDLVLKTHQLLRQQAEVLRKYQERFRYIFIDEFQDINKAQYAVMQDLAGLHKNICVVGDDAQSIYAFRGANIHNMLSFEKDNPQLKLFKLEQNYRSTQCIVRAANAIIARNSMQLEKKVWTDNPSGEPIHLIRANMDAEEGKIVAASIFEARAHQKLDHADFAVLYRTNSQSRIIEESLRKMNLPYRIVGGTSFYQRKEVKDLLAYLRLLVNPNDEEALKRVINLPKRGIGPGSVDKIVLASTEHQLSLWEVVCNAQDLLGPRLGASVGAFASMIQGVVSASPGRDAYEVATNVAKQSGLLKELAEDKTLEGVGRYENVQELLNAIKAFTTHPNAEDTGLEAFLQEVALSTDLENTEAAQEDKITLMTIHAAKGLEFAYVYIVGVEEDIFPSTLMLNSREDLEEERRLFYVALTRAKRKVYISYALNRYRFGRLKHCQASRFIEEIDASCLQLSQADTSEDTQAVAGYASKLIGKRRLPNAPAPPYAHMPQPMAAAPASDFAHVQPGAQVVHPTFGTGTVVALDTKASTPKARIHFGSLGEKTLLLRFAKLKLAMPSAT